jgi:hypothetical protein
MSDLPKKCKQCGAEFWVDSRELCMECTTQARVNAACAVERPPRVEPTVVTCLDVDGATTRDYDYAYRGRRRHYQPGYIIRRNP